MLADMPFDDSKLKLNNTINVPRFLPHLMFCLTTQLIQGLEGPTKELIQSFAALTKNSFDGLMLILSLFVGQ